MKLAWREIKIFGIRFTLPAVLVVVQQLDAGQVEQFRKYRAQMAECPVCHKLYRGGYHLSMITHLVDAHEFSSTHSIEIVEDLGRKTLERRRDQCRVLAANEARRG